MSRFAPDLRTLALAACSLSVGAAACGEGEPNATDSSLPPITTAPPPGEPTTTSGGGTTTTGDTGGTTSTTTSGVGEGDSTTGDPGGTTGTPGCAVSADDADEDGDAIANKDDNCRCVANPKQLDFDGDAIGNVCDAPLVFTLADGVPPDYNRLDTNMRMDLKGIYCELVLSMVVETGEVLVQLDDTGAGELWFKRFNYSGTYEQECDHKLGGIVSVVKTKHYFKDFFADSAEMYSVGFPFFVSDHEAGLAAGAMTEPHRLLLSAVFVISETQNQDLVPEGETYFEQLEAFYPAGKVSVLDHGQALEVKFANNAGFVFDQVTMLGHRITLTGLKGTLRLVP